MSDTKFTPGSWAYTVRNNHEIQCTFVGVVIDGEYVDIGFANEKKDRANAHLIAAAPDMYAILDKIREHLDDIADADIPDPGGHTIANEEMKLLREVEAVIAKARGKS